MCKPKLSLVAALVGSEVYSSGRCLFDRDLTIVFLMHLTYAPRYLDGAFLFANIDFVWNRKFYNPPPLPTNRFASKVVVGRGQYRNAVASGRRYTSVTEEYLHFQDSPDAIALRY